MAKKLKITLVKSPIGYSVRQKTIVQSLGLRRMNYTVLLADSPTIRGMVKAVPHLVNVEEVEEA